MSAVRAPFTWQGNKTRAARLIWDRLGDVDSLIDPFCGSLATYLASPLRDRLNPVILADANRHLINLWRALTFDPTVLEEVCRWPVDTDMPRATANVMYAADHLEALLKSAPDAHDRAVACSTLWTYARSIAPRPNAGLTLCASNRGLPHWIDPYDLAAALDPRRVTLLAGDWTHCLLPGRITAATRNDRTAAVIFDPPYAGHEDEYACDTPVATAVYDWAAANGDNPTLRIVACGHTGDAPQLLAAGWEEVPWVRTSGIGGSRTTAADERLWFSPACHNPHGDQLSLLEATR